MVEPRKKKSGKRRGRPPGSTKLAKALEQNIAKGAVVSKEGKPAESSLKDAKAAPSKPVAEKEVPPKRPTVRHYKNPQAMDTSRLKGPLKTDDGELYFSRIDLMLFELTQEKVRSAAFEVKLVERELQRLELEYEAKRLRQMDKIRTKKEFATIRGLELNTLRREIEHVYEVELKHVVYDDETGRITIDDSADTPKG